MKKTWILSMFLFFVPALACAHDTCPELTTLQVWAGYLSWIGFLKICGIVVGVVGLALFFKGFMEKFWEIFWQCIRDFADVLAHLFSFALIISGHFIPEQYRLWAVLSGCLLFAASVIFTVELRNIESKHPSRFFGMLFAVWSAVAVFYNMSEVGFIAVMALMATMGFTIIVTPGCYMFGYTDDDESIVIQGTTAALMILLMYILQRAFLPDAPDAIKVFSTGAFWVGSFVGFLGLLIMSDRWYIRAAKLNYLWMQIVTVAVYIACISYGYYSGINPLSGMAGTFLVFYFPSKIIEIEKKDMMAWGLNLMLVALFFYGIWLYAVKHEAMIKQFMTTSLPG